MPDESGTIRDVAWEEVFPWLMILRSVRQAISVPVLFVATLGVLVMPLGWWGASLLLWNQDGNASACALEYRDNLQLRPATLLPTSSPDLPPALAMRDCCDPIVSAAKTLVYPLCQLLRIDISWSEVAYWSVGGFWNLLVWAMLGGTITRMAVMRYGREEREGLVNSSRFVRRRLVAFVGAPLFALLGVIVVLLLSIPVGWIMHWDVGLLLASLIWFFVILGGLIATIFMVGLLLGWPLMWGALSSEEMGDVFEGAQRTYAYVYGRPLHYLFYAVFAVVIGSAMFHVMHLLAQLAIYFSVWAVSWGSGVEALAGGTAESGTALIGASIIAWLNALVLAVAAAFRYSFLFTAAGVIYLLVRRDADRIELDNVYAPGQETRYALPPLTNDQAGVPGVDEDAGS